jgi:hypothetical protein
MSVLSIGVLKGSVGLAYAYWQAKQSLYVTVGTTFQELARQSADKVALLLTKEVSGSNGLALCRKFAMRSSEVPAHTLIGRRFNIGVIGSASISARWPSSTVTVV